MAAGVLGVLGAGGIAGWVRYLHKQGSSMVGRWVAHHIAPIVCAEIEPVITQLSPNGGKSIVDRLARIETRAQDFSSESNAQFAEVKAHLNRQDATMTRHLEQHAK